MDEMTDIEALLSSIWAELTLCRPAQRFLEYHFKGARAEGGEGGVVVVTNKRTNEIR